MKIYSSVSMAPSKKRKSQSLQRRVRVAEKNLPRLRAPLLRAVERLVTMEQKKRQYALRQANKAFIRALIEALKRVRRKPLPFPVRSKLRCHRHALRKLVNPATPWKSKRRVLVHQRGGFFGAVLASLAAPLIGSVVKALTKQKILS